MFKARQRSATVRQQGAWWLLWRSQRGPHIKIAFTAHCTHNRTDWRRSRSRIAWSALALSAGTCKTPHVDTAVTCKNGLQQFS